ncbi:MAG: type II toxin-antitoxin system death-on-curing family toxin [Solirubrobacteraceae bacterium]
MSTEYLELADYLAIAAEITGLNEETLIKVAKLDLADSALHAPGAGFGEVEFYPDFIEKAAVLVTHLAKNHPLPDGNKRAAWVSLRLFIEINALSWKPAPNIDDAERAVLAIASGDWSQDDMTTWLKHHLSNPDPT